LPLKNLSIVNLLFVIFIEVYINSIKTTNQLKGEDIGRGNSLKLNENEFNNSLNKAPSKKNKSCCKN
jgi:hypothetical protein